MYQHNATIGCVALLLMVQAFGCERHSDVSSSKERLGNISKQGLPPLVKESTVQRYRKHWAIVIGIDRYDPAATGYSPLRNAVNDANSVAQILKSEFGYSGESGGVLLLTDESKHLDLRPTKANVERAITEWLPSHAIDPDDCALFFFAGHGENDDPGYLACLDSRRSDLRDSAVSLTFICNELHERLKCRHKGIILTSCYSGRLFDSKEALSVSKSRPESAVNTNNPLSLYLSRSAMIGISAGREKPVLDRSDPMIPRSPFAEVLIQEMEDRCDSLRPDRAFRLSTLGERIQRKMENSDRNTAQNDSSHPPRVGRITKYDDGGDYVFVPTFSRVTPTERSKRTSHAVQLSRVRRMMDSDFLLAKDYLFDVSVFPHNQRDISWQLLATQAIGLRATVARHSSRVQWMQVVQGGSLLVSLDIAGVFQFTVLERESSKKVDLAPKSDSPIAWCAALSPDEQQLFVGMLEGTVRVYDVDFQDLSLSLRTSLPLVGRATSIAACGKCLAVTTDEGTCSLFDLTTMSALPMIAKHEGGIFAVALSSDGSRIATGCTDGRVRVWKFGEKMQLENDFMHLGTVMSISFLDGDRPVVAALANNTLRVWDVMSGLLVHSQSGVLTLSPSAIIPCTYTSNDNAVFEFDLSRTDRTRELVPPSKSMPVYSIMNQLTGNVFVALNDGTVIRTVPSGRNKLVPSFRWNRRPAILGAVIVEEGNSIVVCCSDCTIRRISMSSFREVGNAIELEGKAQQLCVSKTTGLIGVMFVDGAVGVLQPNSRHVSALRRLFPGSTEVSSFFPSTENGMEMLVGSSEGDIVEWNIATNQVRSLKKATGHLVTSIATVPNTRTHLIGIDQEGISILSELPLSTAQSSRVISGTIWALAVSPINSQIAAFGTPNVATVFSYPSFRRLYDMPGGFKPVWSACYSPDEQSLVTGGEDGWLRIYDSATGISLFEFPSHKGRVDRIAFSPDGRYITSIDDQGELAVWPLTTSSEKPKTPSSESHP